MSLSVLTALIGFRQAQVMRHLWTHGPATVRELHTALAAEVSYNTVLMTCRRLIDNGLLERRGVTEDDAPTRPKQADVYAARVSEDEVLQRAHEEPTAPAVSIPHQVPRESDRAIIEQLLVELGRLRDDTGRVVDAQLLAPVGALLARAEAAEQAVLIYQAEALRALHRAAAAERRAELAEDMAAQTELPRRRALPVPSTAVYEYRGEVCRVCGRPAPPPPAHRRDGLRVCSLESCRQEARRRDNVSKQQRSIARKRQLNEDI